MDREKLLKAIEFAKQNPNSPQAQELKRRIQSGQINLKEYGIANNNPAPAPVKPVEKKGFLTKARDFLLPGTTKAGEIIGETVLAGEGKSGDFLRRQMNIPGTKQGREEYKSAQASQTGLDDLNQRLGMQIAEMRKEGKDTKTLEEVYKNNTGQVFNVSEIAPSVDKSAKEIYGAGASMGVEMLGFGSLGTKAASMPLTKPGLVKGMVSGAKLGAGWGAAGAGTYAMAEGKENREILQNAGIGAVAGGVLGGIMLPAVGGILRKSVNALTPSISYLTQKAEASFAKGVRPLLSKMQTAGKKSEYYNKALDATEYITANKDKLKFTDPETGLIDKGRLPKNLAEFAQAIEQMKTQIYRAYDALAQKADLVIDLKSKEQFIDIDPVISKLKGLQDDLSYSPQIREYANSLIAEIRELKGQPTRVIQERIKELNSSLAGFYENRTNKYKAQVDASVANLLREQLDNTIERLSNTKGYGELKKMYGAFKTIERDVNRRALVVSRNNTKGLTESITDIFSGGDLLMGAISGNPAQMARGFGMNIIGRAIKNLNSSDKQVEAFFKTVDKLINTGKKESLLERILRGATKEYKNVDEDAIKTINYLKTQQPGLSIKDVSKKGAIRQTTDDITSQISKAKAEGKSFQDFVNKKNKLNKKLLEAQASSDSGKYSVDGGYKYLKELRDKFPEYDKILNSMVKPKYDINGDLIGEIYPGYLTKQKAIQDAIKIAGKEKIKVAIGKDKILWNQGFGNEYKNVPVVYFETKNGQISFHMPDWNPINRKYDAQKDYLDVGDDFIKIPKEYQYLFNKNYKFSGEKNTREILEKNYSETKSQLKQLWDSN